ncbi:MAG: hypothetical protein US83_C0001G0039 [Candidatus Falkowbacteria bacterium GW2011_GWC2_38_22]|uniref:AMIN domain-containing protein n=1 Tax=Candidatus Falkowbacteria bacterium GW2011_GWE1_38_31 TaxID=1618638 RepID=A0A0G0K654_9BACT|nr:MAG: hypothetical protein US73_C0004G0089 [Candidatus Falkowbacteria bacterium GW2011_GWF2_38_1205]KKQ62105.1 MAG: hypothetical protein US83_C0001G0039 [Candidatus Falkowbacteria bacterium GW2011_GWC2_38_22]KKQ64255.1 MAG: hypothetical protein US84_C0001G0039 [Candidatus Falkowbacteria bacterium GW2011_GWF1_38_22]KKQ66232.1 MAG: hypothetical protein US87_C0002G0039 [Candidatus Falkowbacteria bacterium GW2011_GWE2_38_254]KKQ70960.1 MAG: hypothetical protein US91_C0002G0039 [Candidatus Falkowb
MKKLVISLLFVMAVVFCFSEKSFASNTITSTEIDDIRTINKLEINFSSTPEYSTINYKDKFGNSVYVFDFPDTELSGKNRWYSPGSGESGIKKISVVRYSEKTVRVVVTIKENFAVSKVDEGKKLSFTAKNVSDAKKIKGVKPTLKNKIKKSTIDDSANIKKVVVEFEDKPKYEKSSYVDMGVRFCIYNFPNTGLKENDWHLPTDLGSEIEQVSIVSFNPQTARIVIRVPENIGIKETVKDNEIIFSSFVKKETIVKKLPEKKIITLPAEYLAAEKDKTRNEVIKKPEIEKVQISVPVQTVYKIYDNKDISRIPIREKKQENEFVKNYPIIDNRPPMVKIAIDHPKIDERTSLEENNILPNIIMRFYIKDDYANNIAYDFYNMPVVEDWHDLFKSFEKNETEDISIEMLKRVAKGEPLPVSLDYYLKTNQNPKNFLVEATNSEIDKSILEFIRNNQK